MQSLLCNLCTAIFALQLLLCALQKPFRNGCMIYVHLLQNEQSWISCVRIAFHFFSLLLHTSMLPWGYLTTSPIHLKRVVLMVLHCFLLLLIAFAYLGATSANTGTTTTSLRRPHSFLAPSTDSKQPRDARKSSGFEKMRASLQIRFLHRHARQPDGLSIKKGSGGF